MEMVLSEQTLRIAQSIGLTIGILILLSILIGIDIFIITRVYKWLIKYNYIKPKEKNKHE